MSKGEQKREKRNSKRCGKGKASERNRGENSDL